MKAENPWVVEYVFLALCLFPSENCWNESNVMNAKLFTDQFQRLCSQYIISVRLIGNLQRLVLMGMSKLVLSLTQH